MPFVVEFRKDVDTTPIGAAGHRSTTSTSASSRARTAPTSPASPPPTTCSATADFDGAAPGAKIVSARACTWGGGCTAAALTDGMIDLVVNRGVDVVNMSIGGLPALNDGNNARAEPLQRPDRRRTACRWSSRPATPARASTPSATRRWPATSSASPPASARTPGWPTTARSSSKKNALFNFSSRGPREDGGFKPNIAAPGSAISTVPTWQPGGPVPEAGYALPAGLRDAQRHLDGLPAGRRRRRAAAVGRQGHRQGRHARPRCAGRSTRSAKPIDGRADVRARATACSTCRAPGSCCARASRPASYTSDAPVCTAALRQFLATPNRGTGVYNRCAAAEGGHKAGQTRPTRSRSPAPAARPAPSSTTSRCSRQRRHLQGAEDRRAAAQQGRHHHRHRQGRPPGAHGAIMRIDDPATAGGRLRGAQHRRRGLERR